MGPAPYSERSVLPRDSSNSSESVDSDTTQITSGTTPESLSAGTSPSPVDHDVLIDINANPLQLDEEELNAVPSASTFYPSPADSMPFDHTFPVFLRQLTNERNLANVQTLKIRVISGLVSLQRMSLFTTNLRELDLEGSILGSLRDIGCNLKFLQVLKVGNCQLDSLDGTFGLTSLKRLYAQRNHIIDVSPCSNLPHIQHIDVSYNRIRNVSYAGFLSVCRKLRSMIFTGNPATQLPDYRNHVKTLIPQLKSLDNVLFRNEDADADNRNESGFSQSECEGECSQEEQSDYYNSTSGSNSSMDTPEKSVSMKDKTHTCNSEIEDISKNDSKCLEAKDLNLLNLRKERDENKPIRGPVQSLNVNIEETEDLLENNLVCSLHQVGDFNNGITLPPLSTNEQKKSSEKGVKNRTGIGEKPNSNSQTSDYEKSSNSELKSGARSRTSPIHERPSTANSLSSTGISQNNNDVDSVRKRPCTAGSEPLSSETDEEKLAKNGQRSLTSGLPICGNLAVALRIRKKQQEREETEFFSLKKM